LLDFDTKHYILIGLLIVSITITGLTIIKESKYDTSKKEVQNKISNAENMCKEKHAMLGKMDFTQNNVIATCIIPSPTKTFKLQVS